MISSPVLLKDEDFLGLNLFLVFLPLGSPQVFWRFMRILFRQGIGRDLESFEEGFELEFVVFCSGREVT